MKEDLIRTSFVMNARPQPKIRHTWIILVIVKQRLVQIGRIDGPNQYSSQMLATIRSAKRPSSSPEGCLLEAVACACALATICFMYLAVD